MGSGRAALAAALFLAAGLAPAAAQVPPQVAAQIRTIGRTVDPQRTAALYAPLLPKAAADVRITREATFGPDPKQALDIFTKVDASPGRPVFIFVHGGAFIRGDKSMEGGKPSPFYDNVMHWAVKNGMVGVNVNYRLAPQHPFPAAQQDIGAAVKWVQDNIARYGGDPDRLYMMGHSAGGAHVASYVAHPEFGPGGATGLSAAIFSSGAYDFALASGTAPAAPHPYFGPDAIRHSSIPGLASTKVPYLVSLAELDPEMFHVQAGKLMNAACSAGRCPPFLLLKDHGHMSEVYAINTSDAALGHGVLEFIASLPEAGPAAKVK